MMRSLQNHDSFSRDKIYLILGFALIVIRPIVDMFWHLKKQHVLLTPGQVASSLLFLLLVVMLVRRLKDVNRMLRSEKHLAVLVLMVALSSVLLIINEQNNFSVEYAVKFMLPWMLLIASMLYVREETAIIVLFVGLLLASLVALGMLYYEIFVSPIAVSSRSGMLRYTGLYRQVGAYGIFILWGMVSVTYLYAKNRIGRLWVVAVYMGICIYALPYIVHLTTYSAVFLVMVSLFLVIRHKSRTRHALAVAVVLVVILAITFHLTKTQGYELLIVPDMQIVQGEKEVGGFANGRGGIWSEILARYNMLPLHARMLGSMWSGTNDYHALGFAAHGDFVRILLAHGLLGLLLYCTYGVVSVFRYVKLPKSERYLFMSIISVLLAFSIALTATFIVTIVVLVMPVMGWLYNVHKRQMELDQN